MSETTKTTTSDVIPFVCPKLGCRVVWMDARMVAGTDALMVGVRDSDDANSRDEVHYRVTPAVHAWVRAKLIEVEEAAYGTCGEQKDEWAALAAPDRQAMREALAIAVGRWCVVDDWAHAAYGQDALAAARPELPRPPEKLPAVLNGGGAVDNGAAAAFLKRKGIGAK
jgi:hypothetical protein